MPLDPQARAYLDHLATLGVPPVEELSVEEARRNAEAGAPGLFGPVESAAVSGTALPGEAGPIPARLYRPLGADGVLPALVYLHGGGWVIGSLDTHDGPCRALANRAGCLVVSADYRLAPEHRFPAAVEDAWSATAWVAENASELAADPRRIAVGGDSAGGNLAAVVALRARDRGLPLALQLLVYPATAYGYDGSSYAEFATGFGMTLSDMEWFWDHYLGRNGDGSSPEASPLRADDLRGVAPALVLTAELDVLRDEGEAYARRLEEARVPVTLSRYDGMIHGFFRTAAWTDRTQDALDEAAAALRRAFSG